MAQIVESDSEPPAPAWTISQDVTDINTGN
jgi:hypothetical protein